MLLLLLFALIAGAGTAITPCVLPVLPALLSASAAGGRRRPFGIVLGLAITFTISIVVLTQLLRDLGLGSSAARIFAIVVLVIFGAMLLIPELAEPVQGVLSRLARFGPRSRGDGFWSGLGVGAALGFVCAPCAGPILGAVIALGNEGKSSASSVGVAVAYCVGLSAVLVLYSIGGRRVVGAIKRRARGQVVERTLGVVLLISAVVIVFNLDTRFETALANATGCKNGHCSGVLGFFVDPTHGLENSKAVQNRLASLRPANGFAERQREDAAHRGTADPASQAAGVALPGVQTPSLPKEGLAPDFTDNQDWFNTPGDRPLTMAGLRGHVVLVDFWTYTCINCIRTLPFLKALYAGYHSYGLDVVGVETPEFAFEQEAGNVRQAISTDGIRYPVVQDNNYGTWNAYQNQYWPADYLIDAQGQVRHTQFGEGDYKQSEAAVRELLHQAGVTHLPPPITVKVPTASAGLASPETYLGYERAQQEPGFVPRIQRGVHLYPGNGNLHLGQETLKGTWNVTSQSAAPESAPGEISVDFQAARVYLVLTSAGGSPRRVGIEINGHPISAAEAGTDVHGGTVTVRGQRLYSLVALPTDEERLLTVRVPPGVQAYDFTFG